MKKLLSFLILITISAAAPLSAQTVELPEFVIVATRTPLELDKAPPSVSVVTADAIDLRQENSVADVLSHLPGISIGQTGQAGASTSIFTRGSESNHTLFLLNGRRINPGFSGQYNLAQLGVDNLSSIEVMRGASSTLYGSESIGGVIDIITRNPAEAPEGVTGSVSAEAGSFGTYRGSLALSAAAGDLGLTAGLSYYETDNQIPYSDYDQFNFAPHLGYRLNDRLYLDLQGLYYNSRNGLPGARVDLGYPKATDYQENETWLLSPGVNYEAGPLRARAYYSRTDDHVNSLTTGFFLSHDDYRMIADEFSLQVDYQATEDITLTTAYNYINNDFYRTDLTTGNPVVDTSSNSHSALAQAQWQATERLLLIAGVRYDAFSDFDNEVTWNASLAWELPRTGTTLFAKHATAYAPPQGNDLYGPFGNPALNAEESDSWELGLKQNLLDGQLRLSALYFYNDIHQRIIFDPVLFVTSNIGQVRTEGLELQTRYTPGDRLQLHANLTFLNAKDLTTGDRLLRRPRYTLNAGLTTALTNKLTAGLDLTAVMQREDQSFPPAPPYVVDVDPGDYLLATLHARYRLNDRLQLYARIENLLDQQYDTFADYAALDRHAHIGLKYSF